MTPTETSEAFLRVNESMQTVIETVTGYRANLEAAGFSPTAAEFMAGDFHRALLTRIFNP